MLKGLLKGAIPDIGREDTMYSSIWPSLRDYTRVLAVSQ